MSDKTKEMSHWKLMLVGTFSVTFRRIFVIALTVISLVVWTVTVIGVSVLRQGGDFEGPVDTAGAAVAARRARAVSIQPAVPQDDPDGSDGTLSSAAEDAEGQVAKWLARVAERLEATIQDPFVPNERCFPAPKVANAETDPKLAAQVKPSSNKSKEGLQEGDLVPLALEGTLVLGRDPVAIIRGNSVQLDDGRTMLLQLSAAQGQYRVGDQAVPVQDARNQFKAGEEIQVKQVIRIDGTLHTANEVLTLKVKAIAQKSVVFSFEGKDYVLEMSK